MAARIILMGDDILRLWVSYQFWESVTGKVNTFNLTPLSDSEEYSFYQWLLAQRYTFVIDSRYAQHSITMTKIYINKNMREHFWKLMELGRWRDIAHRNPIPPFLNEKHMLCTWLLLIMQISDWRKSSDIQSAAPRGVQKQRTEWIP